MRIATLAGVRARVRYVATGEQSISRSANVTYDGAIAAAHSTTRPTRPRDSENCAICDHDQTTGAAATVHTIVSVAMTARAVDAIRPATRHGIGDSHERYL